jgi:hypothetical protein
MAGISYDAIAAAYSEGKNDAQVAVAVGCSRDTVLRWRQKRGLRANAAGSRSQHASTFEEPGMRESLDGTAELTSEPGRIMSLDELLARFKVDRNAWDVERHIINKYEQAAKVDDDIKVTELFQVKAWLRRNPAVDTMRAIRDEVIADMRRHAPKYPKYPNPRKVADAHMLEVSAFDLHIGKLAWGDEVDGENYDSKIAEELLLAAVDDLLQKASGFPIERILFPVGNDLLHTDTPENTTTRGTRQDVDTRPLAMFCRARDAMVKAIDRLMLVAPVDVIVVPGNHDRENALRLGVVLDAWYRNTDRVHVDASPTLRKYVTYGVSLLGYTHGSEEKPNDLPLLMAQERPREWAVALHKEWHTGHLHKRKEVRHTAGDTFGGVVVRILPSLAGTDAWHHAQGYTKGIRAAEAYLWSEQGGYAGHFSTTVQRRAA